MMAKTLRKCDYCQQKFEAKTIRKKYCSSTCKTYASQVRTGKRPALTSSFSKDEVLTEERKRELTETAKQLNDAVLKIKEENEKRRTFIDNPPTKKVFEQKQKINELTNILNASDLKKSDKREIESEIALLEEEIKKIEACNDQILEKAKKLELELEASFLESFRILERRNQFILTHLFNKDDLQGDSIEEYQNLQTRYPFKEMDNRLFATMGTPVQPFFALINGEKESGKSILSTMICKELLTWFKAKILFVVDHQNQRSVLEYFALQKVSSGLLTVKFAHHLGDIEKALADDNYEFLFIDSNHHFKLNQSHFRKLRKMHPFLSIFLSSRYRARNIEELPSIEFRVFNNDDPDYGVIRRGWADVYTNGVLEGEYDCGVFLNNESQGFMIGF